MCKQTSGRFQDRKAPDIKHLTTKGKRFVLQHHFRGASEHIDNRYQINHVLNGFTMAAQYPNLLKAELAIHWKLEKNKDEYSLFWDGELAYHLDKKENVEKIFSVKKGTEPFEWLDVVGVTKPREIEPEPGGTRYWPGIFVPIDSGIYYPGAIKPHFCEYFLQGKKWKGLETRRPNTLCALFSCCP
jgi:hypothetical protein